MCSSEIKSENLASIARSNGPLSMWRLQQTRMVLMIPFGANLNRMYEDVFDTTSISPNDWARQYKSAAVSSVMSKTW